VRLNHANPLPLKEIQVAYLLTKIPLRVGRGTPKNLSPPKIRI
jgi:hypothetical protein